MFNGITTILIGYLFLFLMCFCCSVVLFDRVYLNGRLYSKNEYRPWFLQIFYEALPVLIVIMVIRTYVIQPFSIPSESMYPQLTQGDYLLVNKTSYALKFPFTNQNLIKLHELERGKVYVFQYPLDTNTFFIKRLIGKGGDTLRFVEDDLYINGVKVHRSDARGNDIPYDLNHRYTYETINGNTYLIRRGMKKDSEYFNINSSFLLIRQNTNKKDGVLIDDETRRKHDLSITIPEGYYFFMGDNRNDSSDSREWGLVGEDLIVGRATRIMIHSIPNSPVLKRFTFERNKAIN